jgi:hypothetical protein
MPVSAVRCAGWLRTLLVSIVAGAGAARLAGAMSVSVSATPSGSVPVGTMISFQAQASGGSDRLWYRFRVTDVGGAVRTIRDYSPSGTLDWTSLEEGYYLMEASVQDRETRDVSAGAVAVRLVSRVQGSEPVVSPTSHPLVYLFSAPSCEKGQARVRFRSVDGLVHSTPPKPCVAGRSLNFYLAGLAPATAYTATFVLEGGERSGVHSAATFETAEVPSDRTAAGQASVVRPAVAAGSQRIILQSPLIPPPVATDLAGRLLWYGPDDVSFLTRIEPDGTFFGIVEPGADTERIAVRRFDLVGMTIQETNVANVNEQLAALGRRRLTAFHHEARSLPGGRIVVLGSVEQILDDVQGPGPINVIGDMIVVLDSDLRVVWTWDTFDHLDTSRRAVLGETCNTKIGCPPHDSSADANDWTHANSVARTSDGDLLLSVRHQDWVIKIDYRDGAGNGDILWRLGKDGDFAYDSADPYPWFSHQHDVGYEYGSPSVITLFDNGNTRWELFPAQTSRGQAVELDEERRTARLLVNVDLGLFSGALGSAQRLRDGTFHFNAGLVSDPHGALGASAYSMQVDPQGNVLSSIKLLLPVYRSFRLPDLYGPSDSPERPAPQAVAFR